LSCSDCGFAYRSSIFNTTYREHYVILRVDFNLRADGKPKINYSDLRKTFESHNRFPTLGEVRDEVLQIRKSKSMVLDEYDSDSKSVGSFFKNPTLTPHTISEVQKEARTRGLLGPSESIPRFAASGGKEKLPAAWFIERAGFHKGYAHGRAGISSRHALALINRGGATAQDILDLMRLIQVKVQTAFGVDLQPEPIFVGFDKEIR
jgi:UDP-N-acetylmuramate dehydrogenase